MDFFTADGKSIEISDLSKHSKVKGMVDLAIGKNTQSMFDDHHRVIGGNATDQALMKFIGEETFHVLEADKECTVTASQGFNSANKFSQARIESLGKTFYKGLEIVVQNYNLSCLLGSFRTASHSKAHVGTL